MKGKKIKGYVITGKIGSGGMGTVFEALRDVKDIFDERKSDAQGIIERLGKKSETQTLEQALDSLASQINERLIKYDVPSERIEFYKTILGRAAPDLSLDDCRRAIKIMNPKKDPSTDPFRSLDRFKKETEAQSRVDHPNVVRVFEGGETEYPYGKTSLKLQYLIMEFVEAKKIESGVFNDLKEAVRIAYEALKGIEGVHKCGFLHRDVKPQNILYGKDGTVKLTDFGLVKSIVGGESLTLDGDVVGTPHYIDPERAHGEDATTASDVYSLGATLYSFVTGMPPLKAKKKEAAQILGEVGSKEDTAPWVRRRNPKVSTELERLIEKMIAKNQEERPIIQEAKEEMESIMRGNLYVFKEPTMKQEQQRLERIAELKGEAGKWGLDHKVRASRCEQLGNLYTADTQEEINARIEAYKNAIESYKQSMPITRMGKDQVEKKISKLTKEIAFEHRRIKELNRDLATEEKIAHIEKKPKNHKRTAAFTAGALAILATVGFVANILYKDQSRTNQQKVSIEKFNSSTAEIERDLVKKDYAKARAEIKRVEERVKELPGSYVQKFNELVSRIDNAHNYDRAATAYASARESAGHKNLAAARTSAEQGSGLEAKVSDVQLKKKLDEAKLEVGEAVYTAVESYLQNEEPREAVTGVELITWLLDKTASSDETIKARNKALRDKAKAAETRMAQYKPQIKTFEEQKQSITKFNSEYARIKEQLKEDKFCKREEIDQLGKTLDDITAKLSGVNPKTVGEEEHKKQSETANKAKSTIQPLKQEFDSQLITYLAKQALKIEQLISTEDYTQADVQEKFKTARTELQAAQAQYENARNINGFQSIDQRLGMQETQLKSLQEKTTLYSALVNQASQGTNAEKAAANTNLLKIYIGFGRLAEAENCLAAVPNKTGLEGYVAILELEKKLSNPSHAKALPLGLTEEMTGTYTSFVNAYKKDGKTVDRLKLYLAYISEKSGADMFSTQKEISAVQELEELVADLRQKARTQNGAVKKQLEEQAKTLEDKRKALYATLDGYAKPAGSALPMQETINQLQNAYRAAGYDKQAAEVPKRFK